MSIAAFLDESARDHAVVSGTRMPLDFGDVAREYRAAQGAAALCHRARRGLVRVSGADHRGLLHGLLTSDVESLAAGTGRQALFLDTKGHVRGVLDLWAEEEATIIGCDAGFIEDSLADLTKYVLAADARFEDMRETHAVLAILGPDVDRLLASAGLEAPVDSPGSHAAGLLAGVELRIARTSDLPVTGVELHVPAESAREVWSAIESAGGQEPAPYLGWGASEALRIEAGLPRAGAEITGQEFPQEARLDDAIDYEKGCYLGQETVARIHYRGQVNRLLCCLIADAPLPAGAELISSERSVGHVTSAADSPQRGSVALGFVRREEAESGAEIQVRHDGSDIAGARVVSSPIGD